MSLARCQTGAKPYVMVGGLNLIKYPPKKKKSFLNFFQEIILIALQNLYSYNKNSKQIIF